MQLVGHGQRRNANAAGITVHGCGLPSISPRQKIPASSLRVAEGLH